MKKLVPALTAVFLALAMVSSAPAVSIYDIQTGSATGTVGVTGIVSLVDSAVAQKQASFYDFFIADASGAYNGICVYQGAYGVEIGDWVSLTGTVSAFNGKTNIINLTSFSIQSRGNEPYAPVVVTTADIADESYEGCLVTLENVEVTNQHVTSGKWQVQPVGGGTAATIDDELDYNYFPKNGDRFSSITGLVWRNTTASPNQWLQPRFTADFSAASDILPNYALRGTVVTMDSSFTVRPDAYVVVEGDNIVEVTDTPPAVSVIEVDGLIFPGLISTHDHLAYGLWDFIPFTEGPTFKDRNEWAATQMYCDFKVQYGGFSAYYDEISKLVEVRMASSGGTVTQSQVSSKISHSDDNLAKLGVGIVNGERYPGRCYDKVVGTTSTSDWPDYHAAAVAGRIKRYMIHLAEATDAGPTMATQWNWWRANAGFDGYDTIIHGINIAAAEYALFDHGLDPWGNPLKTALSWACKSNMLLYNQTADVAGALAQGAVVALAPDWTESGMPNMLAELNYCRRVAFDNAWNIQTRSFVEMLTSNAAFAFGQSDRMGSIEPGKMANFMVIADGTGDPYDDLMMVAGAGATDNYRCGPKDVKLTVVAGRPLYGDADLLNTANFPFLNAGYIEDITICSTAKKLSLARYNGGGYSGVDELFNDFYGTLWTKYNSSSKYPCDFLSYDPEDILPPTPAPTATPPAGTYVILQGSDDAHNHLSYFTYSSDYVDMGNAATAGTGSYSSGFRFQSLPIPQGATVTSAILRLTQYTNYASPAAEVTVRADDTDNSQDFASGSKPSDRTQTTASVIWTIPVRSAGQTFESPDLSAVLNEVVNRPGWSSGNSLTVISTGNSPGGGQRRRAYSYEGSPAQAAQLIIEFNAASPTPTPFGFKSPTPSPTQAPTATATLTPFGYKTPVPTPTPSYTNLLPNPSFESWTSSTSPQSWTTVSGAAITEETGIVHAGSKSVALSTTTTAGSYGKGIYADASPVDEGETYTFQMWVYSVSPGSMGITANWYVGGTIYWDTVLSTTSGQWELLTVSATAPAGATNARCAVRGFLDNTFCGYADDGACYRGASAPTPTPVAPTPVPSGRAVVGDYSGDGTSDIAVFRPSTGLWLVRHLTRAYFGAATDQPVPRDYSGDGAWDFAIYRPSLGKWMVRGLTSAFYGVSTDLPVPADYDGDGTADVAVFRPTIGKWLVRGGAQVFYGFASDTTVPGDYDGDSTTDIAVFRPSLGKWLVKDGPSGFYGVATDTVVPGDYTGDGSFDFAVFRPTTGRWLVKNGPNAYWGTSSDTVQPGDYDGDGTLDFAVWRSSVGRWLIANPSVASVYYGASTDVPVTNP